MAAKPPSASLNLSLEQSKGLYAQFRHVPVANLPPDAEWLKELQAAKVTPPVTFTMEHVTALRTLARIAQSVSESEFIEFMQKKRLPPVKLSAQEMEVVRGGIALCTVIGIVALGAGAIVGGLGAGDWYSKDSTGKDLTGKDQADKDNAYKKQFDGPDKANKMPAFKTGRSSGY